MMASPTERPAEFAPAFRAAPRPALHAAPGVAPGAAPGAAIEHHSEQMTQVWSVLRRFAATDAPVLITGESGTGKEVSARAIHAASRRRDKPLTALNCAALPSELIASELFGYEKGAFTGAAARKIGQIEHAHGGTLFLDEIGDMPIDLQSHLLRFLQEGTISRVGGRGETIPVDVRIIAATNVDLSAAMRGGRFREDLFFRLNVLSLHMPPLRDRVGDLEPLVRRFIAESAEAVGGTARGITAEAMAVLAAHDWPGNVRELKSSIFRAVVMCGGTLIQAADLSLAPSSRRAIAAAASPASPPVPNRPGHTAGIDRETVLAALRHTGQNVTAAAAALGVSRVTFYRLLQKLDVTVERPGCARPGA